MSYYFELTPKRTLFAAACIAMGSLTQQPANVPQFILGMYNTALPIVVGSDIVRRLQGKDPSRRKER